MAQAIHSKSEFQRSNGFLRLFTVLIGAVAIGVTAFRFRVTEFNEVIYLTITIVCCSVSFIHFFLTYLVGCAQDGPCFKIADFIFHMTGGILLLVSSVLMLLAATNRGHVLEYRFGNTKHVVVRTIAGIFGLENAFLYFTLSYLTITNKHFVHCESNPKPKKCNKKRKDVGDKGGNDAIPGNNSDSDPAVVMTDAEAETAVTMPTMTKKKALMKFFMDRFTWRRLLVDEILEARLATVFLGTLNIALIADSYHVDYEVEEYFCSMVVICFMITLLSQISYASGAVRISESVATLIDMVIQLFSCANLFAGGVLMLGSVIENSSYGYQYKSVERTCSAVLGIINGCLYCYIGVSVKRTYFSRPMHLVNYDFSEESGRDLKDVNAKDPFNSHMKPPATEANTSGICEIEAITVLPESNRSTR